MTEDFTPKGQNLRDRAENLLQTANNSTVSNIPEEYRQLLHELQVHQIELELQNEELRNSQNALEKSRSRYMQLYHNAPVGYVVLNRVGLIKQANATFTQMVAMSDGLEKLNGKPFVDLLIPTDQSIFLARLKSFFKNPNDKRMELRIGNSESTRLVIRLEATSIQRLESPRGQYDDEIFVIVSDITDRIKAEEALQESEARWRKYILHAPVGVFVANMKGEYQQVNPAACRITGLSESELLSKSIASILPEESRDAALAHFQMLLDTGASYGEVVYRHPKGDKRWWSVAAAKISDEQIICFVEDVTERKNQEKQQEQLQNQINQLAKAESLGRMAGAIAHYFNNTLMVVLGNLELAVMDAPQGGEALLNLKPALEATERASEMSRLMLTYLGQTIVQKESVDLSQVCKDGLPLLLLAKPENIDIEIDCPYPGPIIQANTNQIKQIIANLLSNAWESITDGFGKIRVATSTKKSSNIRKQYSYPIEWQIEEGEYACIEVQDNGCGIRKDNLEKLFDPFFSSKFPGRGMGLAVVIGILRSHNGGIVVESQPGKGSIFRVYLPIFYPTAH